MPSYLKMMRTAEIQILNEDMIVAVVIEIANKPEKSFGTSTGFEPITSVLALQCYTIWAMKTHTLEAGQYWICWVHLNPWKEWNMKMMWTAEIQISYEDMIVAVVIVI